MRFLRIMLLALAFVSVQMCFGSDRYDMEGVSGRRQNMLNGVHRILVLGDSITQAGEYVVDIECWLLSKGNDVEVLNMGLGSETATDLTEGENEGHLRRFGFGRPPVSERLDRVLKAVKPEMVIACYGMNDGGSLPADEGGDKRFVEAVTALRKAALDSGVKRVVICTPPVQDSRDSRNPGVHDGNLKRYSEWIMSKASDWDVVDIHGSMRKALDEAREKDPGFKFAGDGVHPGREGHWLMAREILNQFFDAKIEPDIASSEMLFKANGGEIRRLVSERSRLLFGAWMSSVTHKRPHVPGGPGMPPGPSIEDANKKASEITRKISNLLSETADSREN